MVCLLVCLSVMIMSPAEMAELIEMSLGMWTWVGPRSHVDGVQVPMQRAILRGKGQLIVKYRDTFL